MIVKSDHYDFLAYDYNVDRAKGRVDCLLITWLSTHRLHLQVQDHRLKLFIWRNRSRNDICVLVREEKLVRDAKALIKVEQFLFQHAFRGRQQLLRAFLELENVQVESVVEVCLLVVDLSETLGYKINLCIAFAFSEIAHFALHFGEDDPFVGSQFLVEGSHYFADLGLYSGADCVFSIGKEAADLLLAMLEHFMDLVIFWIIVQPRSWLLKSIDVAIQLMINLIETPNHCL